MNTEPKTKTPETETQVYGPLKQIEDEWVPDFEFVPADFARRLEVERDQAHEELAEIARMVGAPGKDRAKAFVKELVMQLHNSRQDADQLRAKVTRLKDRHKQSPEYLSMLESMLSVKAERDQLRAEVERLREALAADDIVPKSVGDKLIALRGQLAARDEALKVAREAMVAAKRSHHHNDEDGWYSCPKSKEGCLNEMAGQDCNCGADHHNKKLDAALRRIDELTKPGDWGSV